MNDESNATTNSELKETQQLMERPVSPANATSAPGLQDNLAGGCVDREGEDAGEKGKIEETPSEGKGRPKTPKADIAEHPVFAYREDLGDDPFRGIIKWSYLEGIEASGKKTKPDVLLGMLAREVGRNLPDRFLVAKLSERICENPKDSKAKDFLKVLHESGADVPEALSRLDAFLPNGLSKPFRDAVSEGWKPSMKKCFSPEQMTAVDGWLSLSCRGEKPSSPISMVYRSAKTRAESLDFALKGVESEIPPMSAAIREARSETVDLSRELREIREKRMDPLVQALDSFRTEIDRLRDSFRAKEREITQIRSDSQDLASALRGEIALVRQGEERERRLRQEADDKRSETEKRLDEANTEIRFQKIDRESWTKGLSAELRAYASQFRRADAKPDSETLSAIFRDYLDKVFRILDRHGIRLFVEGD